MADETAPVRSDPIDRRIDGSTGWDRLIHRDPNKHYVLVMKTNQDFGPDLYESLGYNMERWSGQPDGLNIQGGKISRKKGDLLEVRGQVVMSIPLEQWKRLQEVGEDGQGGQILAAQLEKQIDASQLGPEMTRGISPQYVKFYQPKEDQ
jgi:hypothetical protein